MVRRARWSGAQLWLDLGSVNNIAEVSVNGKPVGILWKAPFRADVLLVNRLIGDQQRGVTKKYAYTAQRFYRENSRLLPSGMLGPVQVVRIGSR